MVVCGGGSLLGSFAALLGHCYRYEIWGLFVPITIHWKHCPQTLSFYPAQRPLQG